MWTARVEKVSATNWRAWASPREFNATTSKYPFHDNQTVVAQSFAELTEPELINELSAIRSAENYCAVENL